MPLLHARVLPPPARLRAETRGGPGSGPPRRRSRCRPPRVAVTAAAASTWVEDLSCLFGWELPESCLSVTSTSRGGPLVVLDGANLLWAYGHSLSRRFGCKIYPASAGLLLALDYEPWRAAGVRITALLPANYCRGELGVLADGCGGDLKMLQGDRVRQTDKGDWVCLALEEAVSAGRVQLVRRTKGEEGRGDDDREILRSARAGSGYVCSNDQFREHFKLRGSVDTRRKGVGEAHLFRNRKRFNEWGRERRFGCSFAVAPGLEDPLLIKMLAAQAHREDDTAQQTTPTEEAALRATLHSQPWRLQLPVYFQPFPGPAMLTAHQALLARADRERGAMQTSVG